MQYTTPLATDSFSANVQTREQAAYGAIRRAIIAGRWRPGDTLVVSRIALELGVSRITVAGAFKRLAAEGFIQLRPHREVIIAPLDPQAVREIYLMRAALEAVVLREAATRATAADLSEARELNYALRRLRESTQVEIAAVRALDQTFHERVRKIAALPRITQTLANLVDQSEYYRACVLDAGQLAAPNPDHHEQILEALEDRAAGRAAVLIEEHVTEGMRLILALLERPS